MSKQRVYMASDVNWVEQEEAVPERFQYEPYGRVAVAEEADADCGADGHAGHCLHEGLRSDGGTSALHRFRNRNSSPSPGRWVQQDPMGYVDGMSLYEYVAGSPANLVDPHGEQATQPATQASLPVTAVFDPVSANGASWWYDAGQALNHGGQYARWKVSMEVYCEQEGVFRIRGTVKLVQRIGIVPGLTLQQTAQTYGHEQRHVRNMIDAATGIVADMNRLIGERSWGDVVSAGREAWGLQQLAEHGLREAQNMEKNHESAEPKAGQGHPPIGTVPAAGTGGIQEEWQKALLMLE